MYLHNDDVKTMYVPQYENLTLKKIFQFISPKPKIALYLPDDPDLPKTPKQWIINVCAAVIGQPFKDWVYDQVEERNVLMTKKREMMITMDPMMAQKFQASTHVSCKY